MISESMGGVIGHNVLICQCVVVYVAPREESYFPIFYFSSNA